MAFPLRSQCKQLALRAAALTGGFTLCRWGTRHRVRIFAYHGVTDDVAASENADGFFVAPSVFEAHLRTLAAHYHVMPLTRLVEAIIAGDPLPDGAAAITFDDGYANNAECAAPLLQAAGLPATFFITTGYIDYSHRPWWAVLRMHAARSGWDRAMLVEQEARLKKQSVDTQNASLQELIPEAATLPLSDAWRMMSWEQIRALGAAGFEIGAHTVSHPAVAFEESKKIEEEFRLSRERILSETGQVSPLVAYPYGQPEHIGAAIPHALRQQGCLAAVTTVDGLNDVRQDPFFLYRLNVSGNHHRLAFRALASGCTVPRRPVLQNISAP